MTLGSLASVLGQSSQWPRALQQFEVPRSGNVRYRAVGAGRRAGGARLLKQMVAWQMPSRCLLFSQLVCGTRFHHLFIVQFGPRTASPRPRVPAGRLRWRCSPGSEPLPRLAGQCCMCVMSASESTLLSSAPRLASLICTSRSPKLLQTPLQRPTLSDTFESDPGHSMQCSYDGLPEGSPGW